MKAKEFRALLKEAGQDLQTASEVIYQLAEQTNELNHKVACRDFAVKLASEGYITTDHIPSKIQELEKLSSEELEKEIRLFSQQGPSHTTTKIASGEGGTTVMDFIR
jgi:hypothetical protein